jgi:hypothetical protein
LLGDKLNIAKGAEDGIEDGSLPGAKVGIAKGAEDGIEDGLFLRWVELCIDEESAFGFENGCIDGIKDDLSLGSMLGFDEGSKDCFKDGCWDRNEDGSSLGVNLKLLGAHLLLPGELKRHGALSYQIRNVTIADGAHK